LSVKRWTTSDIACMNGLEYLYHILFVEIEFGLWGIIGLGVAFAILSYIMDYNGEINNEH
jgi:hypothetical protein